MPPAPVRRSVELLADVQLALHLTQKQLAELMGCSRRTIIRYYQRGGVLLPSTVEKLAHAVHPSDPALAAELAATAGQTLVGLGLEAPAAARPPLGAPPALAPARRREASSTHLADSIVCAAAEAMSSTPQAMRPALAAALQRMIALHMTAEEVLTTLRAGEPVTGPADAKP